MTDKKELTARDISAIIKACKSSGVSELQFGDLWFKLGPSVEPVIAHEEYPFTYLTGSGETLPVPSPDQPTLPIDDDDVGVLDPSTWEKLKLEDNQDG